MNPTPPAAEWFMVEIRVGDWPRAVAWYAGVLGLPILLEDGARRFALLGTGAGRVALKGGGEPGGGRDAIRLTFLVPDVDAERARLLALGEAVSEPIANRVEGYCEIRLHDPEGTPISLFSWTDNPPGP